jgi:hypothetical protein
METLFALLLWLVVGGLMLAGLVVLLTLPSLYGPLLIFAGAAVHAVATGFTPIGAHRLAILAALTFLIYVFGNPLLALGAVHVRASGPATLGIVAGAVGGGGYLGAPGLLLGAVLGAVAGEALRTRRLGAGVRGGLGALYAILWGGRVTLVLALSAIGLFFWWVWAWWGLVPLALALGVVFVWRGVVRRHALPR